MLRKRKMDSLGRQIALQIGGSRVGIGIATFLAPQPALRALGFSETNATGRALARILGARDIGVGCLTLAVRDEPKALRHVILASSCLDLADAIAFGVATANPETRRPGLVGVLSGGGAAAAGLWAYRRLGRP